MTNSEAKQALARQLDISYSDISNNALFSDADLQDWIQAGVEAAWDYKPWPFTQKAKKVTTNSDGVTSGYYDNPVDLALYSIFLLKVAGETFKKLDFQDYEQALEDNPSCTDKIWADWETYIFVNANAYTVGGLMDLFGKKLAPALSGDSDLLPFSPQSDNSEHSGNHAIVKLAYAAALMSEKRNNPTKSALVHKEAESDLDQVWQPYADAKANAQNTGRSMFNITDMFGSGSSSKNNIGNFNL